MCVCRRKCIGVKSEKAHAKLAALKEKCVSLVLGRAMALTSQNRELEAHVCVSCNPIPHDYTCMLACNPLPSTSSYANIAIPYKFFKVSFKSMCVSGRRLT
eukprot:scpid50042/ scgid21648/ 